MLRALSLLLLTVTALQPLKTMADNGLSEITGFGSNPGSLQGFVFVPEGKIRNTPMVVVLHGCLQDAQEMERLSGWQTLAEQEKFVVLYPQQTTANNPNRCFNWFLDEDIRRDGGEALSIKQMILYAVQRYKINPGNIYITGMSAGGAMSLVMAATYPELFDKAGVMAGVPYGAASDIVGGLQVMGAKVTKSPEEWSALVRRQNPDFKGQYPELVFIHGSEDNIVHFANTTEIAKQWAALWSVTPDRGLNTSDIGGNPAVMGTQWQKNGKTVMQLYAIKGMGHAIAVDPGPGPRQGGMTATFAQDVDFHSSWWTAEFFGLIRNKKS